MDEGRLGAGVVILADDEPQAVLEVEDVLARETGPEVWPFEESLDVVDVAKGQREPILELDEWFWFEWNHG